MTQQSLITRLKAVEEALNEIVKWGMHYGSGAAKQCEAALSDLRELIKEAEGQKVAGAVIADFDDDGMHGYIKRFSVSLYGGGHKEGSRLYTALGEKPAAAEQQLAKETKE